jgi:hypothetical protein
MERPANLSGSEQSDLTEVPAASSAIRATEMKELEEELRGVRRKANWHFVWTLLGVSPGAIIPALGLMGEGSRGMLILLGVAVTISQGYMGAKASTRAKELETAIERLKEGD